MITTVFRSAVRQGRIMRLPLLVVLLAVLVFASSPLPAAAQALPAFPGAIGHGTTTPGGRGGAVLVVSNLNDGGPGSLRAALEAKGPRIVVFRVGGTIRQTRMITIREPFLTIAGQTAPGDGIAIRGPGLAIQTHDVIVRGLRIRVGDDPGLSYGEADGLRVDNGQRVVIDHCSFSWGVDENLSTSTYSGPTSDVTFQWNIVSEALYRSRHPEGPHSMGMFISERSTRISVHHNLLAHNNQRNPLVKGGVDLEFVNNVVYGWGQLPSEVLGGEARPTRANFIGNTYQASPATASPERFIRVRAAADLFFDDNAGVADGGIQRATASGLAPQPAATAYEAVLQAAGVTHPRRDTVDTRVVGDVRANQGRLIDSPAQVGGWPLLAKGEAPPDGDRDGMPDAWERAQGLNPAQRSDSTKILASGYTAIEEYINGLFGQQATPALPLPTPTTGPSTPPSELVVENLRGISNGGTVRGVVFIDALVRGTNIEQVVFELDGPVQERRTQRKAPYGWMGDSKGVLAPWDTRSLPNGSYSLTATATDAAGQQHRRREQFTIAN